MTSGPASNQQQRKKKNWYRQLFFVRRQFSGRNDRKHLSLNRHAWAFWFCPYGGQSPSVGAQSPFCGDLSPLHDVSSVLPAVPSPSACKGKKSRMQKWKTEDKRFNIHQCNSQYELKTCLSPEVPLFFCSFSLSKSTSCWPHWASTTSTFPCTFAQLSKLEDKSGNNLRLYSMQWLMY